MGPPQPVRGPQRAWWTPSGFWALVTWTWVSPLISRAAQVDRLEPQDAYKMLPTYDDAPELSKRFEQAYSKSKEKLGELPSSHLFNNTTRTLIWLYRRDLLLHTLWVLIEVAIRLLSPLILRQFLLWLRSDSDGFTPPVWRGWLLALALGVGGFSMAIMHHRLFWVGMRMGFTMRQQCVAAVHAKALRLNAAAVAHISQGHVVNLVSNDVRRFDDAMPFWVFLWAGPLELCMVLLMVALELGIVPALAGIGATLALIPAQAILVRPVAGIRKANAAQTDERVRLAGEVISGALAMKMLSWELPFSRALSRIRQQEARHVRAMARIRAVNQSLIFAITPVVAFATFATYRGLHGELSVASVFYSLSLLQLPALYMVQFFVLGLQNMTELRVSLVRLDKFLSTQEPPLPGHMQPNAHNKAQPLDALSLTGDLENVSQTLPSGKPSVMVLNGSEPSDSVLVKGQKVLQPEDCAGSGLVSLRQAGPVIQPGTVALQGADYDWLRPLGHGVAASAAAAVAAAGNAPLTPRRKQKRGWKDGAASAASPAPSTGTTGSFVSEHRPFGVTLSGIRMSLKPGELLGVCGEVGAGKSSLLAALLGELQPLPDAAQAQDGRQAHARVGPLASTAVLAQPGDMGDSDTGPVIAGKVAYCAQVPWIVAASVRDNILFGQPYDAERYASVLSACALDTDIQGLPAGDATELGERGINLSGGQKARVALARAAYSFAHVMLLDDPLSACDPRVARTLFTKCIGRGGLMEGSTRVLVTHQRQFLPHCDRVLVLRMGQVVGLGTWPEVDAMQLTELRAGATGAIAGLEDATVDELVEDANKGATKGAAEHQLTQTGAETDNAGGVDPSAGTAADDHLFVPQPGLKSTSLHASVANGNDTRVQLTDPSHQFNPASISSPSSETPTSSDTNRPPSTSGKEHADKHVVACPTTGSHGAGGLERSVEGTAVRMDRPGSKALIVGDLRDAGFGAAGTADDVEMDGAPLGSPTRGMPSSLSMRSGLQPAPSMLRRALSNMFARGSAEQRQGAQGAGPAGWARRRSRGRLGPEREETGTTWQGVQEQEEEEEGGDRPIGGSGVLQLVREAPMRGWSGRWRQASMGRALERVFSLAGPSRTRAALNAASKPKGPAAGALVQEEDRVIGSVPWKVYGKYIQHVGTIISWFILLGMISGQACFLASQWWLALWANSSETEQREVRWLWVYGLLTGLVVVLAVTRSLLFFEASVKAATRIHDEMAITVFRAPLSFFHTNPAGRILNRFSKDLGQVDDLLPVTFFDALQVGFQVLSAFVLVAIAVPFILPVFLPLAIIFVWLRARYLRASREVKRWEATSRSPVFATFSATLKGLPTIRAYNATQRFQEVFLGHLSHNGAWYHAFLGVARWVGFRLDIISACTLLAAALLAMATRGSVQPALLALALTHVLQLTGFMQWFVRQTAEVENIMTSMERMLEYTSLPQEPPLVAEGGRAPPEGWPKSGALEYQSVTAVYRPGLQPVLVDISFKLEGGCSCGVVGRTGSGKSSLMLTLFRLIPVTSGTILLDSLDTAHMGLDALRRQLAIIPQDPVLFSGTVRGNLDPWDLHPDDALWRALSAAKLQSVIASAGGLGARMAEAGDNLSVGQRQLFCLARALLQRAKVLALDEATANVDRGTDALIQGALREFAHEEGRVLLVIAHRIDTIMDTDRLLVLNQGRLVEQGEPQELAGRQGGMFAGMVAAAQAAHAASAVPSS